jgi:hypothetical protein
MEDCCQQCGTVTFDTCERCGNCESCGHNCSSNKHSTYYALQRRVHNEDLAAEALSAAGFNRWSKVSLSIHYHNDEAHLWGEDVGIEERH